MPEALLAARRPSFGALAALGLVALVAFVAVFGPYLALYDATATNASVTLRPPSFEHPFGTDALGRDVFSRVLAAARMDVGIATISVAFTLTIGAALGAAAGWSGGWTDRIISRLIDAVMAFPLFVLAVGVAAALGNSVSSVVIATVVVNLPLYARQTRSDVSRKRASGYVEAAQLAGLGSFSILSFHVMPNVLPSLVVLASLNMGWAILNAAGLSFLGLGIRPPQPEWGIMVSEGASYIVSGEYWLFLFPGAALAIAILTFSLLGDALRDRFDPRRT
jgi:peptide/nickel transport system permease protein